MYKKRFIITFIALICILCSCSNNSINSQSWYYNAINYEELWKYSKGDSQKIAFIDSGISTKLEKELGDRIIYKHNVISDTDDVNDFESHGTQMISIACNTGSLGVYGLATESEILVIKVTDGQGKTESKYLSTAIKDAVVHGATIINMSIGGHKNEKILEEAIDYALMNNVTIIAAAGDYGNKDLLYPAKYDGVISVQGLDASFELWEYSNHEDCATITFPCQNIKAIGLDNSDRLIEVDSTGTSQATSLVSAYVALLKDYYLDTNQELSNEELIKIIHSINSQKKSSVEYIRNFCN